MELIDHRLVPEYEFEHIIYVTRPVLDRNGEVIGGLHAREIFLNNPDQLNSYTTAAVKEIILAFQQAGCDRQAVAVIFSGEGDRAFCTGGNTKEYAEYYAGRPLEYAQYMWLFNMMVTSILTCQIPVICRVNGMRVAGGQEIGMACDFTISGDHAIFGQAGPRHGSAPVGGSTDFLPGFVGVEKAMNSAVRCQMWTALQALQHGLITEVAPVFRLDEEFVRYPLIADDDSLKSGKAFKEAKVQMKEQLESGEAQIDLSQLDKRVDALVTELIHLFPMCVSHTIDQVRQVKWQRWAQNFPGNRQWLAQNMMGEALAGFRAYEAGWKTKIREVDFVTYRKLLAEGRPMDQIIPDIYPWPEKS